MMDHRLSAIESLCRGYLVNWQHPSRQEETERLIKKLHQATAPKAHGAAPEPPALGVHVSDGLAVGDKVG